MTDGADPDWPALGTLSRRAFMGALPLATIGCSADASDTRVGRSRIRAAEFRTFGRSDFDVLQAAFTAWRRNGGGVLELEPGHSYQLGMTFTSGDALAVESLDGGNLEGNGATLETHSVGTIVCSLIRFSNCRNITVRNLAGRDRGYSGQASGARLFALSAGSRDSGPFRFENVRAEQLLTMFHADGPPAPYRVRGIQMAGECHAIDCYYGINFQDQGDGLTGRLVTINCRRSYFPYGVSDHDLSVVVHHDSLDVAPGAESCVLIKRYNRDTRNITLDISFSGVLAWAAISDTIRIPGSCVTLEHQHDPANGPSIIENVAVTFNVISGTRDPYHVHRVVLRSLRADGSEEKVTRNIWRNISIAGELRPGPAPAIVATSIPTEPVTLHLLGTASQASRAIPTRGFNVESAPASWG